MPIKIVNKTYDYLLTLPGVAGMNNTFKYMYNRLGDAKSVVPPTWSNDHYVILEKLYKNDIIKFIAFPLTMYGQLNKLCDPRHNCPAIINNQVRYNRYRGTNNGVHPVALLYNKQTKELEVIDYEFGIYNIYFNYEQFMNHDLITDIRSIFSKITNKRPSFQFEINAVKLPMMRENRFFHLRDILKKNKFPSDFNIIYKSYIANYLYVRTLPEYIDKPVAYFYSNRDVLQIISPTDKSKYKDFITNYIHHYLELCRFMVEFPYDSKWLPLDNSQVRLFDFNQPCPKDKMRNFFTGECIDIPKDIEINLPHFEMKEGKPLHPDHPIKWIHFILSYLQKNYKNTAILIPDTKYTSPPSEYMIQFNDKLNYPSKHIMSTRAAKQRMELKTPYGFNEFIDKAMLDTNIRFIICIVGIKYEGAHASPVIIDKDTATIERIEVNAPFIERMGATVEDDLDNRLEHLFKSYSDFKDFEYIRPMAICPYGLHRAEFVERTENVSDIGGRCFEWTLYYIHLKLSNEDVPTHVLASYAFEELRKTGSIKHMITAYTTELIKKSRRKKSSPIIKQNKLEDISSAKSVPIIKEKRVSRKIASI